MRKCRFLAVFSFFLLGLALTAQANLYLSSGQYNFNVAVRNQWFKDVSRANGWVSVSGNYARIEVESPGYRRSYVNVYLNPNQTAYYTEVRLDETFVTTDLKDETGKYIEGAHLDTFSQNMYWGDEYGIRGFFPKAGFQNLTERKMEILVNSMWAFAPRVYLNGSTDRWTFEIVVRRQDMNTFSNRINIRVQRDAEQPTPPAVAANHPEEISPLVADYQRNLKLIADVKGNDFEIVKNRLSSLANRIRGAYVTLDAGEKREVLNALSADVSLVRELKSFDTFNEIYPRDGMYAPKEAWMPNVFGGHR